VRDSSGTSNAGRKVRAYWPTLSVLHGQSPLRCWSMNVAYLSETWSSCRCPIVRTKKPRLRDDQGRLTPKSCWTHDIDTPSGAACILGFQASLHFSQFVARKIWRRPGVSPLCCKAHRLQRRESFRGVLLPRDPFF